MSINRIKKAYNKVKDDPTNYAWIEPEMIELISAMAEHLVSCTPVEKKQGSIEGLVSISEYVKEHWFVAEATLRKLCHNNHEFSEKCAVKHANKWFLRPDETTIYLRNSPVIENRIQKVEKFMST